MADPTGPVVAGQLVELAPSVTVHVPRPVGRLAVNGPVAVAVKVIVEPRAAVDALAATAMVGETVVTVVVSPEVGGVAK